MEAVSDLYYAKAQWEEYRDRIVNHEDLHRYAIHNYFALYEEYQRAKKLLTMTVAKSS